MTDRATAQTSRHPLTLAIKARLQTVTRLTVYVGEVPAQPPVLTNDAGEEDPSGRVAPYAVVYPGAGLPDLNPSLGAEPADFLWSCQTTFVAGYTGDLDALLDDAVPLLQLWSPTVAGLTCGLMRHPEGYDPGYHRRDQAVDPHRFYMPLPWRLHIVTAPNPPEEATQ